MLAGHWLDDAPVVIRFAVTGAVRPDALDRRHKWTVGIAVPMSVADALDECGRGSAPLNGH